MHFTIESTEGLPIRGDLELTRNAEAVVVIVHGFKGFKDWGFFPWLGEQLCARRLAVCRFNMSRSGVGESGDSFDQLDLFADDTYSQQIADLHTVVDHVHRVMGDMPTFLLGHSRGGGVAILGANDVPNLKGVVTWSAISTADRWDEATKAAWRRDGYQEVINARTKQVMRMSTRILDDFESHRQRLDILAAARALRVPLLSIHGGRDESVPVAELASISAAAHDASRLVISRASHTYNAIHPLVHVPVELSMAALVSGRFISAYTD